MVKGHLSTGGMRHLVVKVVVIIIVVVVVVMITVKIIALAAAIVSKSCTLLINIFMREMSKWYNVTKIVIISNELT